MSEKVHIPSVLNSRWKQFRHPSGRRIHIAATPEEHEKLKIELTKSEPDLEFDLCIRGSPEHVGFLPKFQSRYCRGGKHVIGTLVRNELLQSIVYFGNFEKYNTLLSE